MVGREILIYAQNLIKCLEFLIGHPGLWHNQTYKPFYRYNKNEHQIYNEIYIGKWE